MSEKRYKLNISEEPHCKELESLGSIFIPLIKNAMSSDDLVGVDIILNWYEIIGKEIAAYCHPIKTKFDHQNTIRTLYVEVPLGGFALEIQHKELYILNKVNSYFGYKAIHKLNVTQNANMQLHTLSLKEQIASYHNRTPIVTKEDENYLKDLTSEIKDENLKKILIKIGKNIISEKKE